MCTCRFLPLIFSTSPLPSDIPALPFPLVFPLRDLLFPTFPFRVRRAAPLPSDILVPPFPAGFGLFPFRLRRRRSSRQVWPLPLDIPSPLEPSIPQRFLVVVRLTLRRPSRRVSFSTED